MDRAMYSSTEIDRMQQNERKAYLDKLAAEGLTEYRGQIIPVDEVGDYVQMDMEKAADSIMAGLEDQY